MVRYSPSPFPASIQRLIDGVVAQASKLGFHGRVKVAKEGAEYVVALRVRELEAPNVFEEMTERERKRRARIERG